MLTLLLALTAVASHPRIIERIEPQEAAKRVSRCGLGTVTTHYDSDLQEDILVASPAEPVSDEQLECAFKVTGFNYTLELPPRLQPRFDTMLEARATVLAKADAQKWLASHGLLGRVPQYTRGVTNDVVFARQIEVMCGPAAKGAFDSRFGVHVLSPDWARSRGLPSSKKAGEALSCLTNVLMFSGFEFGAIGNEASPPGK